MNSNLNFFLITANQDIAKFGILSGINYVMVDLEINGKIERQGHLDTVISKHTIDDVRHVRSVVPKGNLLVRINPYNEDSKTEINDVINAGADALMLPMFKCAEEVEGFVSAINGRARAILLVETVAAVKKCEDWLKVQGIDQVHIGLNDLHLEMGLDFMFEPLLNGVLDTLCQKLRKTNIPFGIGGLARIGEGMLPAEILLAEHVRLGSTWAILSRTFHRNAHSVEEIVSIMNFKDELNKLRIEYAKIANGEFDQISALHNSACDRIYKIVKAIREEKNKT